VINDVCEEKPLGERAELNAASRSLQAALDEYPEKGAKIDYERMTGVCKASGTKKKTTQK